MLVIYWDVWLKKNNKRVERRDQEEKEGKQG
jgi:hypothetical protein